MSRNCRFTWCITIALLLLSGSTRGDSLITVWNDLALQAIRYANVPPPAAVRQMAVVHVSIYDSASGLTKKQGFWIKNKPDAECSLESAVSESAYRTLRTLFPKSAEMFDSHHRAILAAIPNSAAKTNGLKWGAQVAREILKMRQFDRAGQTTSWVTNNQPGYWQRTLPNYDKPLYPHWGQMQPFGIASVEEFSPPPPPPLASAEWAAQYNLLKSISATNSTTRTPQQREIALFWQTAQIPSRRPAIGTESPSKSSRRKVSISWKAPGFSPH
jgi:hypothetical protein